MASTSGLTPKQERFATEVASGKTQGDAYRLAFNVRPDTLAATVLRSASKLMADPTISTRVDELRVPVAEKAQITLEGHLNDLKDLRDKAAKENQFSAAISAEIARGKGSGVHVERSEVTGADGAPLYPPIDTSGLSSATMMELLSARRKSKE